MFSYPLNIGEDYLEIYRFPYEPVDSNMYFIPSGDTGIVLDPNENDELLTLFQKYGTQRVVIVLTHEHYDHTSGTLWVQSKIESILFCQKDCAESIASNRGNDPKLVAFVLSARDSEDGGHRYEDFKASYKRYTLYADVIFDKEYELVVNNIRLHCFSMPGHSPGSMVMLLGAKYVFTGDSLIQNTPTILRFPESDKNLFNAVTRPFLKSLDENSLVFPGHGDPFIIKDAKYL